MAPQMTFVCIQGFQLICNISEKNMSSKIVLSHTPLFFLVTFQFIIINNLLSAQYITTKKWESLKKIKTVFETY